MVKMYLALGSNIGDRKENLRKSLECLEKFGVNILRTSAIYESEPVGFKDQGWFLNMVVQAETDLAPADLLKAIKSIEFAMGRVKVEKWGPRIIDIDILLYDDLILREGRESNVSFHEEVYTLIIPHPLISERRFVLEPLAEIAPEFIHPVLKKSIKELLVLCKDASKIFKFPG